MLTFGIAVIILLLLFVPLPYLGALIPVVFTAQKLLVDQGAIFDAGEARVYIGDLYVVAILVRVTTDAILRRHLVWKEPLFLVFSVYVAINVISTLFAWPLFGVNHTIACFASLTRFLSIAAVMPIMANAIRSHTQLKGCIGLILGWSFILVAIQLLNLILPAGLSIGEVQGREREFERYFGPVGDSVGFILTLSLAFGLSARSIAVIVASMFGIVLTGTIGAIIASAVVVLAIIKSLRHREVVLLLGVFSVGLVLILVVPALQASVGRLFQRLNPDALMDTGGAQRLWTINAAMTVIRNEPVLGVGYMGFERAAFGSTAVERTGATANANSQYLQIMCDSGIVGLIAFAYLMVTCLRTLRASAIRPMPEICADFFRASFVWLLSLLFGNLVAPWFVPGSMITLLLFLVLGMAVAAHSLPPALDGATASKSGRTDPRRRGVAGSRS